MVLKVVRYLGQQGYGTQNMVVLTPYLGQLSVLRDLLRQDNDTILNELDSFEMTRAGLMTEAASKVVKRPLRLSTIGKDPQNLSGPTTYLLISPFYRQLSRRGM